MNKIEFMAMSLPSGLKIQCQSSNKYNRNILNYYDLIGISRNEYTCELNLIYHFNIDAVKPVLHPPSDLTKEIDHGGERFIPIERLGWLYDFDSDTTCQIRMYINQGWTSNITELPFDLVSQLIEWHFDIANLIEKGEAIDANTLEVNPYK